MSAKNELSTYLYLPIEIKVRELDAKLLLAYHATLSGFTVVIGEQLAVEKTSTLLPQGIYFSKGYPSHYKNRVATLVKNGGHRFVELDEEGLIIADETHYLRDRIDRTFNEQIDHVYCWGPYQFDLITTEYDELKKKSFITGNPRFDLLNEKYKSLYTNDRKLEASVNPTILLNTRFALYNSIKGMRAHLTEQQQYIKALFNEFIKLVSALSEHFPNVQFVLRPHPAENEKTYERAFSNVENVRVASIGNVITSILEADLMIHNGCTTGIEAFLLRKPVISYMPITHSTFDVNLPNDVSLKASTIEDVVTLINEQLFNSAYRKNDDERTHSLEKYCLTSSFAYEQIIQHLQQLRLNPLKRTVKNKVNNFKSKKTKYRFPSLSIDEISTFFKKLNQIENINQSFHIQKVDDLVYKITAW